MTKIFQEKLSVNATFVYPGTLWMHNLTHNKDIQKQGYTDGPAQQQQPGQTECRGVTHKCNRVV